MRTILPSPIDMSGIVARRTKGAGLEAPNPVSGGLVAETSNPSMSFANEIYRRSGGAQGIAPTAEQLAYKAQGGGQLTNYQWNSIKAGKYAASASEELLWHQTGGRLGLPGNPDIGQASSTAEPVAQATSSNADVSSNISADHRIGPVPDSPSQSASSRWFDSVLRITKG